MVFLVNCLLHLEHFSFWWGTSRIGFLFSRGRLKVQPYSLDFRKKIIDIYVKEALSQRCLARRFGVAPSFIQKLLKQYRETGSVAPKQRTQQTPTKLNAAQLAVLQRLVEAHNDATLAELKSRLAAATSVHVSRSTIDRMLKKLNITVKKRHSTRMKRNPTEFNRSG